MDYGVAQTLWGLFFVSFAVAGVFGLRVQPMSPALASTMEGFTSTLSTHRRGIVAVTVLYAILFMYFQQTLLIDGLTYTASGVFELHLLPGQWVVVSTLPPTPNMPFPLWGWPYISVTTNYFDLALTPLSLVLTLAESFLVSAVIFLYVDIYHSTRQGFAKSSTLGVAQTLTLLTVFLSCTCEFFEGVLAAVEPAAGIISQALPSLLARVDVAFLLFSLAILVVSTTFLSARIEGVDLSRKVSREGVWFMLYTLPLAAFVLLEGNTVEDGLTLLALAASLAVSKITGRRVLSALPAPILAYLAIGGQPTHSTGLQPVALALSALLGVALAAGSDVGKSGAAALLVASALSFALNPYLAATPILMLATSLMTRKVKPTLKHYVTYQSLSWAPIMLGPIAVAFRPVPPIPQLGLQSQTAFYVYLWLLATPLSWYLGIRSIYTLMEEAGVNLVRRESRKADSKTTLGNGTLFLVVGALAVVSQVVYYYFNPQVFLVSAYNTQTRNLVITSTSLVVSVLGVASILAGLRHLVLDGKIGPLKSVAYILEDRSKAKVYWAALTAYLVFSLVSVGTFAWGGEAPPGLPTPSVGVFSNGPLLYAPSATIYLTKHFGIVLVPEHILVATITSILVATSYKALAMMAAKPRARGAGLLAGTPAVMLSCPTCTATAIYSLLGLNSTIAGLGIIATPLVGTLILAATWVGLSLTILYASKKLTQPAKPPLRPYFSGANS